MTKIDDTGVISVRVCKEVKERLQIESEIKSITLNTLIGQILTKHIKWDIFAGDIGLIFLTKPSLRSLLQYIDEKSIRAIAASTCKGAMHDVIIFMKGNMNIDNFLEVLDLWIGASHIPFRHIVNERHQYIIQHDLGRKWSIYVTTVIGSLLSEIEYKIIEQKIDDNSVSFAIQNISK